MRFVLLLIIFPFGALAADFSLLDGDTALSRNEAVRMTANRDVIFYEGDLSRYSVGGAYSYSYAGGGTAFGTFEIKENGVICIAFKNGRSRCDRFVHSHGRVVMISEQGDRFAVRP
jgi:hypothetical protein